MAETRKDRPGADTVVPEIRPRSVRPTDDQYRDAARDQIQKLGTVQVHAAVHPMADGGAFVEATIYVTDEEAYGRPTG